MCNHNTISRNEKNPSKLVILRGFSVLCYIIHFQITKFNRLYMGQGGATFSHTNPLTDFWGLNCHQILYSSATDLTLGSPTYFFLLFPFLVFTKSQVLHLRMGRSRDPLLQKAYKRREQNVSYNSLFAKFSKLLWTSVGKIQCLTGPQTQTNAGSFRDWYIPWKLNMAYG